MHFDCDEEAAFNGARALASIHDEHQEVMWCAANPPTRLIRYLLYFTGTHVSNANLTVGRSATHHRVTARDRDPTCLAARRQDDLVVALRLEGEGLIIYKRTARRALRPSVRSLNSFLPLAVLH